MKRLPDVHLERDARGLRLERVGVKNLALPVTVLRQDGRTLASVGRFSLSVSVDARERGAHLSRLAAAVQDRAGAWSLDALETLCDELKARLGAEEASAELALPFFVEKAAPVSGARGLVELGAVLRVRANRRTTLREVEVRVPVTTLCPCSKAISDAGAHNQRTLIEITAEARGELCIEELAAVAEAAASCEVFAVLKRPDEKWVTERAYARPRFVEDAVREAALALGTQPSVGRFRVSAQSLESIHAHDAFAELIGENPRPRDRRRGAPKRV